VFEDTAFLEEGVLVDGDELEVAKHLEDLRVLLGVGGVEGVVKLGIDDA
jgi:hypothetical protein